MRDTVVKSEFVDIDDELRIHYRQAGCGDNTILLVPGWTMSTRVFERQLDYFDGSGEFRFITFDPRAHGLSSNTAGGHFYERHGRDLHAFIEALQLDRIVLGGWSFGCLATLACINRFGSDRLAGFIMLDGPPRPVGDDNRNDWVTYRRDDADGSQEFYTMGRLRDPVATNRAFAAWMLENTSEANLHWVEEITSQTPDSAAALLNASSVFLDYRDDLVALDGEVPLCYIVRAGQRRVVGEWSANHTPSARVHAFGEHLMFWERADEFNLLLTDFARACRREITAN